MPQAAAQIPWFHTVILLEKVKDPAVRDWYAHASFEQGWSRNVLEMQIESRLHERQGKAVSNFSRTLPPPQSDLAQALLKDPYNFDFLTLTLASERVKLIGKKPGVLPGFFIFWLSRGRHFNRA